MIYGAPCEEDPDTVTPDIDCGHDLDCSEKPDGWYQYPYSCVKYWRCTGGTAQHFICPEDQLYDSHRIQCDYPNHLDNCGDRPPCNECNDGCPTITTLN